MRVMTKSDSIPSLAISQLKSGPLDVFSHYFLASELEPWEHGYYLTEITLRFLFTSNRILSTFFTPAEFTIVVNRVHFYMRCRWTFLSSNPILIIAVAVSRRDQASKSFVLDDFYTNREIFEEALVRLIFWAKRHDVSLYLSDYLKTRPISLLLFDIALIPHPLQAEKDSIQCHYGMNMANVFVLPAKNEKSERKLHYNRRETNTFWDERTARMKRGYLLDVFHPKATEIFLEHCDGFMIYQHLPLPKMPYIRSLSASLPLHTIGNENAVFFFRKIAESLREAAPKCQLFFAVDVDIYAVDFDASWEYLNVVPPAVKNSIQIVEGNPDVGINFTVTLHLVHGVNQVTPEQKTKYNSLIEQLSPWQTNTQWYHASITKPSEDSGTVTLQITCMFGHRDTYKLEGRQALLAD
ncbi:unnamed protein product [Bursaphelenchus xylophilus]|uniref:(pine wood nematode) hypothetical protein n=1 Tax=Bursaphelenchus xylophilus TaxID=6326 RepID=A0A1I7SVF6_BURXY|nr:unnamed protein product [Bursaphelenchus xylophilus]CAG9101387.1 unnamed protein product [Bursaphelenchus xylophilus]